MPLCVCRFVLAAVSPAVVVPSMLLLQRERYGVEKVSRTNALFSYNFLSVVSFYKTKCDV